MVSQVVNFKRGMEGSVSREGGTFVNEGRDQRYSNVSKVEDSEFMLWARQLVPMLEECAVIFASYVENRFTRIKLLDVVQKLKDCGLFESAESVNFMLQPNFIKIKFDHQKAASMFQEQVSEISSCPIIFVTKECVAKFVTISVSNIPADLIMEFVSPQLSNWGKIIRIIPQLIPKGNGKAIQVGATRFEFKFKENVTIEDLPYFVKVSAFKVYLYIKGRKRICFRCAKPDHLVSDCPVRFCGVCRSLQVLSHSCKVSYAAILGSGKSAGISSELQDNMLLDLQEMVDSEDESKGPVESSTGVVKPEIAVGEVVVHKEGCGDMVGVALEKDVLIRKVAPNTGKRMRTRLVSKNESVILAANLVDLQNEALNPGSLPVKTIKKQKSSGAGKVLGDLPSTSDSGAAALVLQGAGAGLKEKPFAPDTLGHDQFMPFISGASVVSGVRDIESLEHENAENSQDSNNVSIFREDFSAESALQ